MTPAEAEDLAARTLDAIEALPGDSRYWPSTITDLDRERVASDLAGLRECAQWLGIDGQRVQARDNARRYAEGLRRTARLYGVTP